MSTMTGLSYWTRIAWRYRPLRLDHQGGTHDIDFDKDGVFMLPIRTMAG